MQTIGKYELIARNACQNLTIFETEKSLYTFGAGWLFSRTVPEPYRRSIDVAILNLQIAETLHQIVQDGVGQLDPRKCNPKIMDIGVGNIGVALLFIVAPFLLVCLVVILFHCCCAGYVRQRRTWRQSRMSHGDILRFCRERLGRSRKRKRTDEGPFR